MKKSRLVIILIILFAGVCDAQEKKPNNFEDWSSKPEKVTPGEQDQAPSDAIVLFHDNLSSWSFSDGSEVTWPATENGFAVVPGTSSIKTRQAFGSCQLHVEWKVPVDEDQGESLNWGNSGLKFMGLYEVQIYNSYNDEHKIYYNGQAASIYKQHSPLVNCCMRPGEWESFDIVFTAPEFKKDGSVLKPAYFTVFQNGILVQNHVEVRGTTSHSKYTEYNKHDAKLPLLLQSHGSAVEYRNIWIRDL
jgi:hypothetical protein